MKSSASGAKNPGAPKKRVDATNAASLGVFIAWQIAFLVDTAMFKILEKSRRIGGTWLIAYEVAKFCVLKKIPAAYFSSADLSAAREFIRYCAMWAKVFNAVAQNMGEQLLDEKKDVKAFVIVVNGIPIYALSSNPKAFRSKGGMLILDEFAWHDDAKEMWQAARPIVTWGYPVRILSTHNGATSQFNQFIERVKKGKLKWSLHTVDIYRAVQDGLVDKILGRPATQTEREEWLAQERESCVDEETWQQEYCCNPLDESSAFLTYEMIRAVEREDVLWFEAELDGKKTGKGEIDLQALQAALDRADGPMCLGYDVARRQDLSVLHVGERIGGLLFLRVRIAMRNLSFRDQKRIAWAILRHKRLQRAQIDASGLGMQLAEEAQAAFGKYKVEAVTFTGAVKEDLAYRLRALVEDRTLFVTRNDTLRESLHSVRRTTTAAGNVRFDADRTEKTGHADDFWALALMVSADGGKLNRDPTIASAVISQRDVYGGFQTRIGREELDAF